MICFLLVLALVLASRLRHGLRETFTKHWVSALGLLFGGFVLNDIPVLDQKPVFNANNVRRYPVHRRAKAREPPVDNHEIILGENRPRLILESGRETSDEIEKAIATGGDMSAMLNVMGRPVPLSRRVVAL